MMRVVGLGVSVLLAAAPQLGFAAEHRGEHWVGTWAASPVSAPNTAPNGAPKAGAADETLREIVHVSLGGASVRIQISNEFGIEPLVVGGASVALRSAGSGVQGSAVQGAPVALSFHGRPGISIPPGAFAVSDAAALKLPALSDLAVSLFIPAQTISFHTQHGFADATNYVAAGNQVAAAALEGPREMTSWRYLKGVDVMGSESSAAVVVFGDSITDGALSTRNANARWPDVLAARLQGNRKTAEVGVLNQGIGGNRVLHDVTGPSALARFDRDVIAQTGVKYVVVMESINDIGHAADPVKPYDVVSAEDIIAGLAQLAQRAHTHGIKVIGATLTPYGGAKYASPAGEAMRQAVNGWIRSSKDLDGVIDFEKVVRDPAKPAVFLTAADSGDHLHPKDAGYKMMGESIDLKMFEK